MWIPHDEIPVSPRSSSAAFVFHQMPPYLSADQFSDWHRRISNLVENIGLSDAVTSDLMVVFSDEEKKNTFGSQSVEEAKREIRERWDLSERANELLDKHNTPEDFHESQLVSPLAEEISAANRDRDEDYNSVRARLEDIFAMVSFKRLVLGEYIDPQRIVLYTKNIERTQCATGEKRTLVQIYEEVFAHEMFHAYHYQNESEELTAREDYTSSVVKESLAAAFEWIYCVENKFPNADALRNEWDRHSVITYPYSGAKNLLQPVPHKAMVDLDKTAFCKIFHTSQDDMDRALRILVPDEFYHIKNLIYYREKVIKLPVAGFTYEEFKTKYCTKKVGQIAREEIPPIISKKPHLSAELLNSADCNTKFGIPVAVLSATQEHYPCGDRIYYHKTSVAANGKDYYLYMHWREKHREGLLKWLWANKE